MGWVGAHVNRVRENAGVAELVEHLVANGAEKLKIPGG